RAAAKHAGEMAEARTREIAGAKSKAEAQFYAFLARSQAVLAYPPAGRRLRTQEILRKAGTPLPDVRAAAVERVEHQQRSAYAATLAVPDLKPVEGKDRLALPLNPYAMWTGAIHPDGKAIAVGLPDRPLYWVRGKRTDLPKIDPQKRR